MYANVLVYSQLTGCESSQELAQTTSPCLWCPLLLILRKYCLLHLPTPVLPILNGLWGCVPADLMNVRHHLLPKPVAAVGNMLAYI